MVPPRVLPPVMRMAGIGVVSFADIVDLACVIQQQIDGGNWWLVLERMRDLVGDDTNPEGGQRIRTVDLSIREKIKGVRHGLLPLPRAREGGDDGLLGLDDAEEAGVFGGGEEAAAG